MGPSAGASAAPKIPVTTAQPDAQSTVSIVKTLSAPSATAAACTEESSPALSQVVMPPIGEAAADAAAVASVAVPPDEQALRPAIARAAAPASAANFMLLRMGNPSSYLNVNLHSHLITGPISTAHASTP